MGFLDSLFGMSGSDNTQAAVAAGQAGVQQGVGRANHILDTTTAAAGSAFKTGAANATDALNTGFGQARTDLTNYGNQAQGLLSNGAHSAIDTILGGNTGYQPYAASGGSANTMLSNALGLNGASGNALATSAFQAGPGYQFTQDQAADQTARKMAALGIGGSGNTLSAINTQAANIADQTYGNWLSNLSGLSTTGLNAANGMSANNQSAGGIQFNAGSQGATLASNLGSNLGNLGTGLGTALGSIQSNLGNALGGAQLALGQGKSQNIMGGASTSANLGVLGGQAADTAENANNSVISKLLGGVIGLPLGGGTLNPGGLSVTPGAGGSFSIAPQASSSGGGGILGRMGIKL